MYRFYFYLGCALIQFWYWIYLIIFFPPSNFYMYRLPIFFKYLKYIMDYIKDLFKKSFYYFRTNFQYERVWKDWWKTNVVFFIDMVILSFGGFTVIGLLGFHTFLMFRGLTTWELVSRERITYLKHLKDDFHPFDEGCFLNMYTFLTRCKYREWECMYDRKLEQDGLV